MRVRPIIMTKEMSETIGHTVLVGSTIMWRGLFSFDAFDETLMLSPAFLRHGAASFRVTIPCRMSKPGPHALVAALPFTQPQRPMHLYLPPVKPAQAAAPKHVARPKNNNNLVSKAWSAASKAMSHITKTPNSNPTNPITAPLHRGYPQSGPVATKERISNQA